MINKLYFMLEKLESYDEFKSYISENPEAYLVSGFFMAEPKTIENSSWQVDFYSPVSHRITSFSFDNGLKIKSNQEVFQKDKHDLEKLDIDDVKFGFGNVLDSIEKIKQEKHISEIVNKLIVLIQMINGQPTWNITCLTDSFKVWNLKFNAKDGSLLTEKIESIISFKA